MLPSELPLSSPPQSADAPIAHENSGDRTIYGATHSVSREERRLVTAVSSFGTMFEWYDFYLYAVLAPFFAHLFFPPGNETAALLAAFATYAAGFFVRPFGGLFFGWLGDRTGRKYTFLISIVFMGFSTFTIGLLPTYASIGWLAPILLIFLRLLQGIGLGGEYAGAAIYVAEFHPTKNRGYATGFIQTTATSGLLLALIVIGLCRWQMPAADFELWGWRVPFLLSILLLVFSIYLRIRLRETPVFLRMKAQAGISQAPLRESLLEWKNAKYVLLSVLGATAGQGVVLYTGVFYSLLFLTMTLGLDPMSAYVMIGAVLFASMPLFVLFGWLSDKIGRLRIILAGCFLAAATYFPLFHVLSYAVNPALVTFREANPITLKLDTSTCHVHLFIGPWSHISLCDRVSDAIVKKGLSSNRVDVPAMTSVSVSVAGQTVEISDNETDTIGARLENVLFAAGYPGLTPQNVNGMPATDGVGNQLFDERPADIAQINYPLALSILFILMVYTAMVYGPMAAFLVELFPAKIRYTSFSFPYHIGNGIFGGLLPLMATALVALTGNVYAGLWYPVSIAGLTCVMGLVFLRNRRYWDQ